MLDARFSHLYFYQSLNRLQRGLSAIAELLVYRETALDATKKHYDDAKRQMQSRDISTANKTEQCALCSALQIFVYAARRPLASLQSHMRCPNNL